MTITNLEDVLDKITLTVASDLHANARTTFTRTGAIRSFTFTIIIDGERIATFVNQVEQHVCDDSVEYFFRGLRSKILDISAILEKPCKLISISTKVSTTEWIGSWVGNPIKTKFECDLTEIFICDDVTKDDYIALRIAE